MTRRVTLGGEARAQLGAGLRVTIAEIAAAKGITEPEALRLCIEWLEKQGVGTPPETPPAAPAAALRRAGGER